MSYTPPPPYQPEGTPPHSSPYPSAEPVPLGYASAEVAVDPGNPWFTIWTRPADVMRWVLANDPTQRVPMLIVLGAIANSISPEEAADAASVGGFIGRTLLALVIGAPIAALISYFVAPWLLKVVGGWLGGTGDTVRTRAAVAYASIPGIWMGGLSILLFIVMLIAFATGTLPIQPGGGFTPGVLIFIPFGLAGIVLAIWAIIIFLRCLAVAHRFSVWLALATGLLAGLIAIAVLFAVALPIAFMLS